MVRRSHNRVARRCAVRICPTGTRFEASMRTGLIALALGWLLTACAVAHAQASISILTGAQGGASQALGVALSQVYAKAIPNARSTAQVTRTPLESLTALEAGRAELAFAPSDAIDAAWRGDEEAGFRTPLRKLRGLSAMYDNYVQIVARADSGIRTVADLKGKRVSVGIARSTTELNARAIFRAAGLSYRDLAKVEYLPFGQSAELMKERQLDATLQSAPVGAVSIRDLASVVKVVVVAVPGELLAKAGESYKAATIPASTYPGQASDVPTAAIPNFLVTSADVPDELAYEMTKALYDNLDTLAAANAAARTIKRHNAVAGMRIPLHPGAARYYREVGVVR
jgi:TRAP transporter TAXI family solute receptor